MTPSVVASARGVARWRAGHPWIYRSDVAAGDAAAGVVRVEDPQGRAVGHALWSPASEIRVRMLTERDVAPDRAWWRERLTAALARRDPATIDATAYRVVHGEGDGLPSLVVDRYGDYVVAQLLSAGLEAVRDAVIGAILDVLGPAGVLLRNDASVRRHEGLPLTIEVAAGNVPDVVEVRGGSTRYLAPLHTGQKTGAFLDQRENHRLMATLARGRALDVFTYHGLFALHMARASDSVMAIDSSGPALEMARRNAALNDLSNVEWIEANAFDLLRALDQRAERFDTIVLDPPAFAKRKDALPRALAGYKEINLRAIRLLAPGGRLLTCSCSYHVDRAAFFGMLAAAASDIGRRVVLERIVGAAGDHPEVITIPETGYLKGAVLRAE